MSSTIFIPRRYMKGIRLIYTNSPSKGHEVADSILNKLKSSEIFPVVKTEQVQLEQRTININLPVYKNKNKHKKARSTIYSVLDQDISQEKHNIQENKSIKEKVVPIETKKLGNKYLPLDKDGFLPLEISPGSITPRQKSRKSRISVTSLITQSWCELQKYYQIYGVYTKQETPAMTRGKKIHAKLEKSVHGFVGYKKSHAKSTEDLMAAKLMDLVARLHSLEEIGEAREIYVFGMLNGFMISGIIDHIYLKDGLIYLSDSKTRSMRNLPVISQRDGAYHQLLIYHRLFNTMITSNYKDIILEYLTRAKINLDKELTPPDEEDNTEFPKTLNEVITKLVTSLEFAKRLKIKMSNELAVDYYSAITSYQRMPVFATLSREVLMAPMKQLKKKSSTSNSDIIPLPFAVMKYNVDNTTTNNIINDSLKFWNGERPPRGIEPLTVEIKTKCSHCEVADRCRWYHNVTEQLMI